jgi:hypothetical protein
VTGSHSLRFGGAFTNGNWRLLSMYTGDVQPITYNNGTPVQVTLRLPTDRRNGIKADTGLFAQDRWALGRFTLNMGLRYDWFIGETQESDVLPSRFNAGTHFGKCPDGHNDLDAGCVGTVQNWKDISPRIGIAWDVFGNGRTAVKASAARYVAGQQIAAANDNNPVTALGLTDTRRWTDRDGNGLPFDAAGNLQFNELAASTSTSFGQNVNTTSYDPDVLNGWFKRGYNAEYTIAAQHQLADRLSVNGGYYRRTFGNQTFEDDLRYDIDSYDGPFCITTPVDPNLPYGGGGYQVCGIYDLNQAVFDQQLPERSLERFSDDFGGETNLYQGFDLNFDWRPASGVFLRGGLSATSRTFDNCNLIQAGVDAVDGTTLQGTELYPDGSSACHREYPYRPDMKLLGSYTLPFDVVFSGTYQFSRGVQTGGAGPSIQANWPVLASVARQQIGREWTTAGSKTIQLIREGLEYGDQDLHQLDLKFAKRFQFNRYRVRFDFDLYNVFNSNWPYTVTSTFSTAASSAWLRPTNVLQSRFFKIGAQLDF